MFENRLNKALAILLLLLILAFIAIEVLPARQFDDLLSVKQVELIEIVLIWCIAGVLLFVVLRAGFEWFSIKRRIYRINDQSSQADAEVKLETVPSAFVPDEFVKEHSGNVLKTIQVITGHAQHIGEREEQQDAFCFTSLEDSEAMERHGVLAVLADGMGGFAMGKEAGQLAVHTMLHEYTSKLAEESVPRALEHSLHLANKAVFELALGHELEWSVGTTLVAAVIHEGALYWISAGDSRIYLYRKGELIPLTRDHVYANRLKEQVIAGKLTEEEANSHPERHLLTSYLGIPQITEIDANQEPLLLMTGDLVILCSDGLYDDLSEQLLEEASCLYPPLAADFILRHVLAQNRPYQDNATLSILACV